MRFGALVLLLATMTSVLVASMLARPASPGAAQHEPEGHNNKDAPGVDVGLRKILIPNGNTSGPTHIIRIMVVADEEFIGRAGTDWRKAAAHVATSASYLMEQVGVGINVIGVERWVSNDEISKITSLLDNMVEQIGTHDDHVMLSLTGQRTDSYDGWAKRTPPVLLLRVTTVPPPDTVDSLFAHELGHILGASHHAEDHDCPVDGCLMDKVGYVHADTWCDHHKEDIAQTLAAI